MCGGLVTMVVHSLDVHWIDSKAPVVHKSED